MAQEPLTNAVGAVMMAQLIVRMTRILLKHRIPEANIEPAIEEIVGEMSNIFGGLGAQVEAQKQRPFVHEKGGH